MDVVWGRFAVRLAAKYECDPGQSENEGQAIDDAADDAMRSERSSADPIDVLQRQ